MSYKVTTVWGSDACPKIGEVSLEKLEELGSISTRKFDTEAERDAYIQGVNDTTGWLEAVTFNGDESCIPLPSNDDEGGEDEEDA